VEEFLINSPDGGELITLNIGAARIGFSTVSSPRVL
jgi:hypothetical protein